MSSLPEAKVCTKCGAEKPATEFYVKDKRTGRLFARCKACHNAETLAKYKAGGDEAKAKHLAYYHANKDERGDYAAKYRQENKEKCAAMSRRSRLAKLEEYRQRQRDYKAANREMVLAKNKEYRDNNRDAINARARVYRENNRTVLLRRVKAWKRANEERWAAIHRKWRQTHKELVRAAGHRRRARLSESAENYTAEQWLALKAAVEYTCLCCGRQEPEIQLTVDHIVPVSKGGGNGIEQIQPLCGECNNVKHAREMDFRPPHLKPSPKGE